ncbi:MAG: hypothetical protein HJJLKODD_02762 [Phycisphaerae bacterium]|nr:hypothetical protein [Phycisphaerae bacterium]
MFDYDWFFGRTFDQQKLAARQRVARRQFPQLDESACTTDTAYQEFLQALECRVVIYMRDGFSYELKDLLTEVDSKSQLTFECEPVEEPYKVGVFVACVPFEEIVRVEVFAVHPEQKPENRPLISGFRGGSRDEAK